MSRRGRCRRNPGQKRSIDVLFASLFRIGDYRFEAATYAADGVDPTKVANFPNTLDVAKTLAATGAQQVLLPTTNANFAGALTATFASPLRYDSSEAASAWNAGHNGSGFEIFTGFRPTSAVAFGMLQCTLRLQDSATVNGFMLGYRTSGTNGLHFRVARSAAGFPVEADIAAGVAVNTATYANASYSSTSSPNYALRLKGTLIASGAQAQAPNAGNASVTLRLGANATSNDFPFVGEWPFTYIFKRVLSPYERAIAQRYIQARFGLAP